MTPESQSLPQPQPQPFIASDNVSSPQTLLHHPARHGISPVPSATGTPTVTNLTLLSDIPTSHNQLPQSQDKDLADPLSSSQSIHSSIGTSQRLAVPFANHEPAPSSSPEESNTRKQQPPSLPPVTQAQSPRTASSSTGATSHLPNFPQSESSAEHLLSSLGTQSKPSLTLNEDDVNSTPSAAHSVAQSQLEPSPTPEPHSPKSSSIHPTSNEFSPKLQQSPYELQLGVDACPRPPPLRLEDFVSPLFLEPFRDLDAVPTKYKPRYTTPFFRQAFSDQYAQYVKAKAKDALPSLFDLEMMAQSNSLQQFEPKEPSDAEWVKAALHRYGIHQDDDKAIGRYPRLWEAAMDIVKKPRDSGPDRAEVCRFKAKLAKYQASNEDTFMGMILPYFMKDERWVPASKISGPMAFSHVEIQQPAGQTPAQLPTSRCEKYAEMAKLGEEEDHVSVEFDSDGMVTNLNRDFVCVLPFFGFSENGQLADDLNKRMMKAAKFTNPRPDRTFGVSSEKLPWPSDFPIPSAIVAMLEVIRACYHIFLIVEGKSYGGSIAEARNQAARGGSIVVHAERMVRAKLGMPDKPGADMNTFIFSLVVTPESLEIWLHWAEVHTHHHDPKHPEVPPKQPTFHMNCIWTSVLNDPSGQNLGSIRKTLHNIMDWGLGERLIGLRPVHDAIQRYAEAYDPVTGNVSKKQKKS